MNKVIKQNTYFVETKDDIINFKLVRGDTITNGKDGYIYTITTLEKISNTTLKQLIENKAVVSNYEDKFSPLKELEDLVNSLEIKIESLTKPKRVKKQTIKKDQ